MSFPTQETITARQRRITRRRVIILTSVYVLFIIHLIHWWIAGQTLSPLELNETMFTIEKGILTIGTILMTLILLSVLLFGRFFCSWGCHILALQDLASWLLQKLHIKPKPIRSRLLPIVSIGSLLYMFVWPTIVRLMSGIEWPGFQVLTDADNFGSFTTEQFTRNLPGPFMTTVTFLVVGGVIVWLMGSRGFCRYVCPYGALFAGLDRISPAGIQLVGDCDGCGKCTPACSSHIRVHHEIQVYGRVVTPGCLKDLDCVASCPRDAIAFGYSKPPLFRSFSNFTKPDVRWAWTWPQEVLGGCICLATLLATRQLYGEIPFLLAITIGVIAAWAGVTTLKLVTRANVRVGRFQLKRAGEFKPVSVAWVLLISFSTCLLLHSGWIRWHEYKGQLAWKAVQSGDMSAIEPMVDHLTTVLQHGLWHPPYPDRMLANLWLSRGEDALALPHIEYLVYVDSENEAWQAILMATRARIHSGQ